MGADDWIFLFPPRPVRSVPRGNARLFDERGPHRLLQYDRSISMIEYDRILLGDLSIEITVEYKLTICLCSYFSRVLLLLILIPKSIKLNMSKI